MNPSLEFLLILMSFSGTFGKYVYYKVEMSWHEAQNYCRTHYTDLAPLSNEYDIQLAMSYNITKHSWIGLMKPNGTDTWMWSGGTAVQNPFPDLKPTASREYAGAVFQWMLHNLPPGSMQPFFCYNVILVQESKTWEKALEYCREHHSDLASVASETEMMLIQSKLKTSVPSSMVWIGLHFFHNHWLWVDGQPMDYNAWSSTNPPTCPPLEMQCVAMKADKRETSSTKNTYTTKEASAWEAHYCYDELPFICY